MFRPLGHLLGLLGRHAAWALFGGILIGLVLPGLAALARPLLAPCVALILTTALLRVEWTALAGHLRRPGLPIALVAWFMAISPVVTWLLVGALPLPPSLATAIVLMAAAPPILSATGLALVLGLDGALAAVAVLIATLLTPLSLPPLALALLGLNLEIGMTAFMLRLAGLIGAAIAVTAVVRMLAGRDRLAAYAPQIDGLFVVFMLIFAVGVMDGVTATALARPGMVALWLAAAFVANPALQAVGGLAFARGGAKAALTVGLLSGNRNMAILLAALPPDSDYGVILFFALGQIPMFMLPAILAPAYRRFLAGFPR
jgi:BASS family bile acid:Na+ symporter